MRTESPEVLTDDQLAAAAAAAPAPTASRIGSATLNEMAKAKSAKRKKRKQKTDRQLFQKTKTDDASAVQGLINVLSIGVDSVQDVNKELERLGVEEWFMPGEPRKCVCCAVTASWLTHNADRIVTAWCRQSTR